MFCELNFCDFNILYILLSYKAYCLEIEAKYFITSLKVLEGYKIFDQSEAGGTDIWLTGLFIIRKPLRIQEKNLGGIC